MKALSIKEFVTRIEFPIGIKSLKGKEKREQTIKYLIGYLAEHFNDAIRSEALNKLKRFGKEAASELINQLDDNNRYVRKDAAKALGDFGIIAHEAIPRLIQIIETDREDLVFEEAFSSLMKIGKCIK